MIMRIWRGTTRHEDAERYARYVSETGFGDYLETPGNLGAHLVQRDLGDRIETATVTFWANIVRTPLAIDKSYCPWVIK